MNVPDEIVERRRADKISFAAFEIYLIFCKYVDNDTGICVCKTSVISKKLGIRPDKIREFEKELANKSWISFVDFEGTKAVKLSLSIIKEFMNNEKTKLYKVFYQEDLPAPVKGMVHVPIEAVTEFGFYEESNAEAVSVFICYCYFDQKFNRAPNLEQINNQTNLSPAKIAKAEKLLESKGCLIEVESK